MGKDTRRQNYWTHCHLGHGSEMPFLVDAVSNLVRGHPCPRQGTSNRGRPPVHSKENLDFVMAYNQTYCETESDLGEMRTAAPSWNGSSPPDGYPIRDPA